MTVKPGFVDSFWEHDFNSTLGFDILCKRLKDGRGMCKSFEDFLKQRSKIEDDYSKALGKLARSIGGSTESGSLRKSWDEIKHQTEAISKSHGEFSDNLNDQVTKTLQFSDHQKNVRKQVEDDVRKYQTAKQQLYKKTMDAKKLCESKCKAEEEASLQCNQTKFSASASTKELEKIQSRKDKCSSDAEKADSHYNNCSVSLEDARKEWEISMENACRRFQELEESRIQFLRNEMWIHTNLGSQTCVQDDDHYEQMRQVLEHCDIEGDLKSFIDEKKTGAERPAPQLYVNYRTNLAKEKPSPPLTGQLSTLSRRPPLPLPSNLKTFTPEGRVINNLRVDDDGDGIYASVQDDTNDGDLHKVIEDFRGSSSENLTLHRGDIVKVTGRSSTPGYLVGHLDRDTLRQGTFPAYCINQDLPISNI